MVDDQGPLSGSGETDARENVGYGKPPKHSRFKQKQSGNPKGRPLGAKGRKTIVEEIANEMHWVEEGGKPRNRSTLDLVLLSLRRLALEGDVRAFREYRGFLERYGPQEPLNPPGHLIVPEPIPREEWEKEARIVHERQEELKRNRKW